jgi:hypothetical protein
MSGGGGQRPFNRVNEPKKGVRSAAKAPNLFIYKRVAFMSMFL